MVPEILIVGDPERRGELLDKVRACAYEVTSCKARDLNRRVRGGPTPGAIIVSTDEGDPGLLLAGLRRTRQGAAIPVILYGRLGGEVRDLADVLDLGADHFVGEDAPPSELERALNELAGPPETRTDTAIDMDTNRVTRRGAEADSGLARDGARTHTGFEDAQGAAASWPENTELIDPPKAKPRHGDPSSLGRREREVLGDLRQTLERLEARLDARKGRGDAAEDDLDLETIEVPSDPEVGFSHDDEPPAPMSQSTEARRQPPRPVPEESAVLRGRRPGRTASDSALGTRSRVERSPREGEKKKVASTELPATGDLETCEVPRLLWELHARRFTGAVTVRRGRAEKTIWLDEGQVVFARSNVATDCFVDGLLKRGVLTRSQYETARRLAAKEPRRAGELLIDSGFLKPRELGVLLRDHLAMLVDSSFAWHEGSYSLATGERCEETILLERPLEAVLFDGIRGRLETGELRRRLGKDATLPRLRVESRSRQDALREAIARLQLSPEDARWIELFDGQHGIDELLASSGADEQTLLALMHTMQICELLAWGRRVSDDDAPARGLGRTPTLQAEAPHDPVGIDVDRVRERVRLAREADYFALLGIPREATRSEVRQAADVLLRTFSDEALEKQSRERAGVELEELRAALGEARDILTDDALRSAYLAHLGDPEP